MFLFKINFSKRSPIFFSSLRAGIKTETRSELEKEPFFNRTEKKKLTKASIHCMPKKKAARIAKTYIMKSFLVECVVFLYKSDGILFLSKSFQIPLLTNAAGTYKH